MCAVRGVQSDRCLDVEQRNQQWTFASDGSIRSVAAGKRLDVNLAATANNSPRIIRPCNGRPNQPWTRM